MFQEASRKLKIAVLTPIDDNLYSLLVTQLCLREPGIRVCGVVVRKALAVARFRKEYKRLGSALLRRAWNKYVVRYRNAAFAGGRRPIDVFADEIGLESRSISGLAKIYGIPYIKVDDINGLDSVSFLKHWAPDLVLFMGDTIIREHVIATSGRGIFNVHMGMLPRYRGLGVTEWPLLEEQGGDGGLGITLHFMDRGVDTGPIIMTQRVIIERGDTFETLEERYRPEMVKLMLLGVRMARDGKLHARPQKPNEGRQYFVLHPRLRDVARKRLADLASGIK